MVFETKLEGERYSRVEGCVKEEKLEINMNG